MTKSSRFTKAEYARALEAANLQGQWIVDFLPDGTIRMTSQVAEMTGEIKRLDQRKLGVP